MLQKAIIHKFGVKDGHCQSGVFVYNQVAYVDNATEAVDQLLVGLLAGCWTPMSLLQPDFGTLGRKVMKVTYLVMESIVLYHFLILNDKLYSSL